MTERLMMYSCIIHDEVKCKGMSLLRISQLLSISYKQAQKLLNAYHPSFEEYNAMSLMRIISSKEKAQKTMEQIKSKVAQRYIAPIYSDKAFHMLITEEQEKEYNAIRRLVLADEYLPKAYRTPKQERKSRYLEPLKSVTAMIEKARIAAIEKRERESKPKRKARLLWTPELTNEFVALYPQTPNLEICQRLHLTLHQVNDKAHFLGLRKDAAYLAALAREKLAKIRLFPRL